MDASKLIDNRIAELSDWRGRTLARIRKLISEAVPGITEEWKWDTPVWSSNGNVLAAGAFQDHLKLNFFYGVLLGDHHLFNAGLDAKTTRAIDIFEGDKLDEGALKDLIRAAVALNNSKPKAPKTAKKSVSMNKSKPTKTEDDLPKLSAPAQRALAGAGIRNLKQLSKFSEKEIKGLHGIGPNALQVLRRTLGEKGLSFANEEHRHA